MSATTSRDEPANAKANANPRAEVAEFQGLYGAYQVSETLLQKLWLRREFDLRRARLDSGEPLRIFHPGAWDRMAGPDFRGAKLAFGDRVVTGDVEVHFHAAAWMQHGHHLDPAYDDVVLHVVLFPPSPEAAPARTRSGRAIPVLVLVDLLWHDLEEYASDEAVAALSGLEPFPLLEDLLARAPEERAGLLHNAAARRWNEKVHFARRRLERLGWEETCHLTALEILGYRSNRVAMIRVGEHFPFVTWQRELPTVEALIAVAADWWTLRGVRPANQPRLRLQQYHAWMQRVPDWPARLHAWRAPELSAELAALGPAALRRQAALPQLRDKIADELCGKQLGGTRLDTWIVNQVLPFSAAVAATSGGGAEKIWAAWYPGDAPASLLEAAGQLGFMRTNGVVQGLLGLQLARSVTGSGSVGAGS